jgi:hypothetical protein
MTAQGALRRFEERLIRLRSFAAMDEAWAAYRKEWLPGAEKLPSAEAMEPLVQQGFDAGYAAAMTLTRIAMTEVQDLVIKEERA